MKKTINTLLLLALMPTTSLAFDYHSLVQAVGLAESNGRSDAIGDSGKARGEYQMWRIAWEQTSQILKKQGCPTYPWSYASDPFIAKQYAVAYLRYCGEVMEKKLGRKPTYWEVYACYARGFDNFESEGFCYDNLPARTKRAIGVIASQLHEPLPR